MGAFVASLVPPPPVVRLPPPPPEPVAPPIDVAAERAEAAAEARRAALAEVAEELRQARAAMVALPDLLAELTIARRRATDQAAADVGVVVLAVLRRVLGDHLTHRPEALAHVIREALAVVPEEESVRIRVHPDALPALALVLPERARSSLVPDPSVKAGCVVEAKHATIEAGLATAMASLEQATAGWVEGQT